MSLKIINMPEDPFLLLAMLAAGLGIGFAVHMLLAGRRHKAERNFYKARSKRRSDAEVFGRAADPNGSQPVRDAADQLRVVMSASFKAKALLNRSEARLFRELDQMVAGRNSDWQVMAQVSLGEILSGSTPEAHGCINSKRVDLLLVDANCRPRHAIEYQGGGHYQGSAAARDAVKKEALRRAGIGYHEVIAGRTKPSELQRMVESLVPAAAGEDKSGDVVTPGPWSATAGCPDNGPTPASVLRDIRRPGSGAEDAGRFD